MITKNGGRSKRLQLAICGIMVLGAIWSCRYVEDMLLVGDAVHGNEPQAKVLLSIGVDPNTPTYGAGAAVTFAARNGNAGVLKLLLSHGGNPNAVDDEGYWSALSSAVEEDKIDCARLLLSAGANPNFNGFGISVLGFAEGNHDTEEIALLKSYGATK